MFFKKNIFVAMFFSIVSLGLSVHVDAAKKQKKDSVPCTCPIVSYVPNYDDKFDPIPFHAMAPLCVDIGRAFFCPT